jgi:ribosomal protein S18 acetylase RimI-like enzyme
VLFWHPHGSDPGVVKGNAIINELDIREFTERDLPTQIEPLIQDSLQDGFHGLERFYHEWITGRDRFEKSGEKICVAVYNGQIIGICGINIDPYANDSRIGRLRRVYVHREFRRQGIAERLIEILRKHGADYFQTIRLYTENVAAAKLYEKMGFQKTTGERVSHIYHYSPSSHE